MSWGQEAAENTRAPRKSLKDEMKERLFNNPIMLPESVPSCVMILGKDGTAKTGLALSILTEEDIEKGKKIVVADLDNGGLPLILEHHRDKVASGNIIYYDPIVWGIDEEDGSPVLDYDESIKNINAIAVATKEMHDEEHNIKGIILDGGSKLLKFGENQMRVLRELDPDSGVSTRFWLIRNKLFLETMELYKSLPFDTYIVFHDDFDLKVTGDKKLAQVKVNTHQAMFQKVRCERIDRGATVEFVATIEKSKFDLSKEGKRIVFGIVNKDEETYEWSPQDVIKELRKPIVKNED